MTPEVEVQSDFTLTKIYELGADGRAKYVANVVLTIVPRHQLVILEISEPHQGSPLAKRRTREIYSGETAFDAMITAVEAAVAIVGVMRGEVEAMKQKRENPEPLAINAEKFRKM